MWEPMEKKSQCGKWANVISNVPNSTGIGGVVLTPGALMRGGRVSPREQVEEVVWFVLFLRRLASRLEFWLSRSPVRTSNLSKCDGLGKVSITSCSIKGAGLAVHLTQIRHSGV